LDKTDRAKKLSELANSPDPTLSIRAIEALNKMSDREKELGQDQDQDGMSEWRTVREYLQLAGGATAIVSLWAAHERCLSSLPLLHDVYKAMMREAPDFWERSVNRLSPNERVWLQSLLNKPDWQHDARALIWREVGIEIEPKSIE